MSLWSLCDGVSPWRRESAERAANPRAMDGRRATAAAAAGAGGGTARHGPLDARAGARTLARTLAKVLAPSLRRTHVDSIASSAPRLVVGTYAILGQTNRQDEKDVTRSRHDSVHTRSDELDDGEFSALARIRGRLGVDIAPRRGASRHADPHMGSHTRVTRYPIHRWRCRVDVPRPFRARSRVESPVGARAPPTSPAIS